MALLTGLLLGVAGSVHCVTMCGPLVALATAGRDAADRSRVTTRLVRSVWHHAGRIVVYSVLGYLAGAAGHGLADAGLRQWVSIVAGAALMGTSLAAFLSARGPGALGGWSAAVASAIGAAARGLRRDRVWNRAAFGVLNGFLPCGLLYGALVAAAGFGHGWTSAGFMFAFGLGSVPALTTVALVLSGARPRSSGLRRLSPIAMGLVGVLLVIRGSLPSSTHVHRAATDSPTSAAMTMAMP
jgi:sulfite exporter TauE/SafE